MNHTHPIPAAPAAVCALLFAFAGSVAAQNPNSPMRPRDTTPSSAPYAPPNQSSLTTAPGRYGSAPQHDPTLPLLRRISLPQAIGAIKHPPADAAVIVVRVPDAGDDVLFDGERTYTAGATRTFVTPILPDGQPAHYRVAIRCGDDRGDAAKEWEVEAPAGRITVVDFTSQAGK